MKILDISIPISNDMPVYPGDPGVEIKPISRISEGAGANVSLLCFGSHTGTHIDPPHHFVEEGLTTDQVPLDLLVGPCQVLDLGDVPAVRIEDLVSAGIRLGIKRVLLKTRNSSLWQESGFRTDFTYLDADAAAWLVERGVRLVGIDYLSIDRFHSPDHATHCRLLEAGVVAVEGLDLGAVPEGMYTLVCLPIKITGGDGGPARAILLQDD